MPRSLQSMVADVNTSLFKKIFCHLTEKQNLMGFPGYTTRFLFILTRLIIGTQSAAVILPSSPEKDIFSSVGLVV